jgi:tetratricopeptide (TPR) repeat protein
LDKTEQVEKNLKGTLTETAFYFIEGMKYFMLEEYDKAKKYFEQVIERDPEVSAAHYKMADLYLIQGMPRDALPYAKRALELDPKNKAYYLVLARIYEFQQDFQKAANVLQDLLNNIEGVEEHYYDLALIQTYLEDYEGALETYQKVIDFFGPSAEVMQQRQRLMLSLNRLDDAIEEGEKLIEAFPNEEDYVFDQVKLLIANERKDEAMQTLDEVLREEPDNPQALILLSDIFRNENKTDTANALLEKAFMNPKLNVESKINIISNLMRFSFSDEDQESLIRLADALAKAYPEDSRAVAFKADVLLNFQRKEEAIEAYKQAIKLDESALMIWTNIVLLYFEFEEFDSVNHYAAQALEIFPNQGRLWFMDGLGYYSKSDYKSAKKSLEMAAKYITEEGAMRSDILSTLGDTYNSLEEYEKSDSVYEEALKMNPFNEHVLNNYSYFLSLRNENLDKALEMCEKLMQRAGDNSTYLDTYAWVLFKLGRYEDALVEIQKAVTDSESGVVHEHYGDILYKLGRKEEAIDAWKKAKEFEDASDLIDKKISEGKYYE